MPKFQNEVLYNTLESLASSFDRYDGRYDRFLKCCENEDEAV